MANQMKTSLIDALEPVATFMQSIEDDFIKSKLHHLGQVNHLDKRFQNILASSLNSDGEFRPRIESLQGSLLSISSAVKEKVESRILFSNRAVEEITRFFAESVRFLKSSIDFLKTDNLILLRWLENEQKECRTYCDSCSTSHEERLIEGVCVQAASLVYLNMLRGFNNIYWQVINVIRLLDGLHDAGKVNYSVNQR